ncbi:MAG: hypothetical protein ACI376_00315 [Candidatus Bruticola sp.]
MQPLQMNPASIAVTNTAAPVMNSSEAISNASVLGIMTGITQKLVKRNGLSKNSSVSVSSSVPIGVALCESMNGIMVKDANAPQEEWMQEIAASSTPKDEEIQAMHQSFQKSQEEMNGRVSSLGVPVPGTSSDELQQLMQ